jgi:hypothetical protein
MKMVQQNVTALCSVSFSLSFTPKKKEKRTASRRSSSFICFGEEVNEEKKSVILIMIFPIFFFFFIHSKQKIYKLIDKTEESQSLFS